MNSKAKQVKVADDSKEGGFQNRGFPVGGDPLKGITGILVYIRGTPPPPIF